MAHEIMKTTDAKVNEYKSGNKQLFKEMLQGEMGLSRLAVGRKFDSDDLVAAESIKLWDYDWVEYIEGEGTDKEREIRFTIWKTEITVGADRETGYYQGGTVLNRMATAIEKHDGAYDDLLTFGVDIRAKWGKTSNKNDILLIEVV